MGLNKEELMIIETPVINAVIWMVCVITAMILEQMSKISIHNMILYIIIVSILAIVTKGSISIVVGG